MHTLNYTWLFKIIKSNSTKIYHKWRYLKVYDTKLFQIILSKTFQKHSIKASTEKSNSWGKENTWLGRASFPAHSHLSQAPHLNKSICCLPKKKKNPACLLPLPLKQRGDCRNLANYLEAEFKFKLICHPCCGLWRFTSTLKSSA